MIPRSAAEIAIRRKDATQIGGYSVVASVLITEKSVRKFMLMQDDYITLDFSLDTALHFQIGDYVDDDVFGEFYITEEQMPKYNTTTGGYDYSLKLERDYMCGKNWVHCLIANGQRMESRWSLTDRLSVHAQQVADNYNISAQPTRTTIQDPINGNRYVSTGYAISIDNDARFAEVKCLPYNGVNLVKAMQDIADAWECEWWVTDDETVVDDTTYKHTIHFGKCELSGDPYEFRLGVNVESMDVSRDQQDYCNRIYAYGGTQNVPETYDRELTFTVDTVRTNDVNGKTGYADSTRPLEVDMVDGELSVQEQTLVFSAPVTSTNNNTKTFTFTTNETDYLSGQCGVSLWLRTTCAHATRRAQVSCEVTLHYGSETMPIDGTMNMNYSPASDYLYSFSTNTDIELLLSNQKVWFTIVWTVTSPTSSENSDLEAFEDSMLDVSPDIRDADAEITVLVDGSEYPATFHGSTGRFTFDDDEPNDFGDGSDYAITNLNINVPLSYYTPIYNAGTLSKVNERRLHLPLDDYQNRYIELTEQTDPLQVVERVVIFDKVFPQMALRVDSVEPVDKKEKIEHEDGSVSYDNWTQYSIKVTKTEKDQNDEYLPFNFKESYILDGATLQAVFTAEAGAVSGHQLSGMTFDLGINGTEFIIIRNENYGAKLPNDILKPTVGDTLFLTGWNPKAIGSAGLGLIEDAEALLATKGEDYLQAIQEGQFTFGCKVMAQWLFDLSAFRFHANNAVGDTIIENDEPFFVNNEVGDTDTTNDMAFYVSNGYTEYTLLKQGARVRVYHDALPSGYKDSRVIGYEYKLDMPYDTPTYTIGETDAYSRLKKIEKELTKL